MTRLVLFLLVLALLPGISQAATNDCEKIAKDFIKLHGGSLVFINPLKPNGAYELCSYCGHFLVKLVTGDYYDPGSNTLMDSPKNWFYPARAEFWDLSYQHPPFGIEWHYGGF